MPRYALEMEWDGTNYAGTAIQAEDPTLTQLIYDACEKIEEPQVTFRCSSRLDAGVSALALACAFRPQERMGFVLFGQSD